MPYHPPFISGTVYPNTPPYVILPRNTSGSYYDDLVYIHMDLSHQTHLEGLWLPWHRLLLHGFETVLKEKCAFDGTLSYWDWTKDAADFKGATFWDDDDLFSGLGGWGDPSEDYTVKTCAFSYDFPLSYPTPHQLRRNFTLQPYLGQDPTIYPDLALYANTSFSAAEVQKMITGYKGDFLGFTTYFDRSQGPRGAIHQIAGGDSAGKCPASASNCTANATFTVNDPIFWLHHAMLEKVWWDWQNYDVSSNFWSFEANSTGIVNASEGIPFNKNLNFMMPLDGFFPEASIRDVMNTTGDYLCYIYE